MDANVSFARNKILYMDEVPKQFSYMNQTGGSTGRQTGVYNYIRLYQYSDFITGADGELTLKPELPQPRDNVFASSAVLHVGYTRRLCRRAILGKRCARGVFRCRKPSQRP